MAGENIFNMAMKAAEPAGIYSNLMQGVQDQNTLAAQLLRNQAAQQQIAQSEQSFPLDIQLAQQQVTAGQLQLDEAKKNEMITGLSRLSQEALSLPSAQRFGYIRNKLSTVDFGGLDENELINEFQTMTPDQQEMALRNMAAVTRGDSGKTEGRGLDVGSQQRLVDDKGNGYVAKMLTDPSTGVSKLNYLPLPGSPASPSGQLSFASDIGETGYMKSSRAISEAGGRKAAELAARSGVEPALMADNERAVLAEQAAGKPLIRAGEVRAEESEKARGDRIKSATDAALAANSKLPRLGKMKKLLEGIETSGIDKMQKSVSDFFGVTSADVGQFDSMTREMVIRMMSEDLKGNPTEGEREYLEGVLPSLNKGGKVNKALIDDMIELNQRVKDRGRWLRQHPDKEPADWLLIEGNGEFEGKAKIDVPTGTNNRLDELRRKAGL